MNLENTLVVGISATALFDLSTIDKEFQKRTIEDQNGAIGEYRHYMRSKEDEDFADGTGMPLVKALLGLNKHCEDSHNKEKLTEVVVMSQNSPETSIPVLKNIRSRKLGIEKHAYTGGESVVDYLKAFAVDLFLTTNKKDAVRVRDAKICAAALVQQPPLGGKNIQESQVRIAFDGDAVIFSEASENFFQEKGLDAFQKREDLNQNNPMQEGPYAALLKKLSRLQGRLPGGVENSPVRIAIVTSRQYPAELRVIHTLRHWGVYVDAVFFLGSLEKTRILEAFRPHIFFDDQDLHLNPAAKVVPTGKVLTGEYKP